MDEFLIARNSINRKIEHDDGTWPFPCRRAQCKSATTCQFASGGSVAWSLGKAGMRTYAYDRVDPMRARNRLESDPYNRVSFDVGACGHDDCKHVARDASTHRM